MSRLLGPIRQNGYVVKDIQTAMHHWVHTIGVGPWFYIEKVQVENFRYRGKESDVELSIALSNSGDLQLELIQQRNDAPSLYKDFLDAGHEGLQHIAFWTTDYQAMYDAYLKQGHKVGHEGQIGGPAGRFSYFDVGTNPGDVVELSDISGSKGKFFEIIRQSALHWDGSDPIRDVKS